MNTVTTFGWVIPAIFAILFTMIWQANRRKMWSYICLIMGILCGVDALVLAMHDPLVWLVAVALVAIMVFRHYRGRNRRRQNNDNGNSSNQQEVIHHVWIHRDDD